MLKQTIQYEDFDGNPAEDTLYFNLSKVELTDNLDLRDRFADIKERIGGEERVLTEEEVLDILKLVKELMELSYGARSEDGKKFRKSPEIWDDFRSSAAYDAYLFSLFEDPDKALLFVTGIMPADLIDRAEKELGQKLVSTPTGVTIETVESVTNVVSNEPKSAGGELTEEDLVRRLEILRSQSPQRA